MPTQDIRPGVYNVDYFSGAQVALYIGDVWVDEVTSISYQVTNSRRPLYGYADELFRDVSKGQVLVHGRFTINFKEAGYLFLVLDRYKQIMKGQGSIMNFAQIPKLGGGKTYGPFFQGKNGADPGLAAKETIESIVNNDGSINTFERNELLAAIAAGTQTDVDEDTLERIGAAQLAGTAASLGGFSDRTRAGGGIGAAENLFETFENAVWRKPQQELDEAHRREDDPRLNPFDIYLTYGDFTGNNKVNHTIQKLAGVHILGKTKQIVIDGQPLQEEYLFIARNLV